ncbi:MAG: hypothetical protein IJ916_12540 [Paludibacteraceae bacterium]|nr:hypothetical protein [Paludibacteraceae bacterium]
MDKLNHCIVFILLIVFVVACDKEVDNAIIGEYNYTIINGTIHECIIEYHPFYQENNVTRKEILRGDSISFLVYGAGRNLNTPFNDCQVYLIFDDSLKYSCWENSDHVMFASAANYYATRISENGTDFRYTITEEDYEYAKAHPYLSKQESEE